MRQTADNFYSLVGFCSQQSLRLECHVHRPANWKHNANSLSDNTLKVLSHRSPFTLFNTGKARSSTTLSQVGRTSKEMDLLYTGIRENRCRSWRWFHATKPMNPVVFRYHTTVGLKSLSWSSPLSGGKRVNKMTSIRRRDT